VFRVEPGKEEEFRYLAAWLAGSRAVDRLIEATETPAEEPAGREADRALVLVGAASTSARTMPRAADEPRHAFAALRPSNPRGSWYRGFTWTWSWLTRLKEGAKF
jgi:hypothetical protein